MLDANDDKDSAPQPSKVRIRRYRGCCSMRAIRVCHFFKFRIALCLTLCFNSSCRCSCSGRSSRWNSSWCFCGLLLLSSWINYLFMVCCWSIYGASVCATCGGTDSWASLWFNGLHVFVEQLVSPRSPMTRAPRATIGTRSSLKTPASGSQRLAPLPQLIPRAAK